MKTRISHFLFAALFSVAVTSASHARDTAIPDKNRLNENLAAAQGAAEPGPLTGEKAIKHSSKGN